MYCDNSLTVNIYVKAVLTHTVKYYRKRWKTAEYIATNIQYMSGYHSSETIQMEIIENEPIYLHLMGIELKMDAWYTIALV